MPMLKVGLTGGIASGKTSVAEMFVALGARLIQADRIAHDLMLPGQPVYDEVVRRFGKDILNLDQTLNRSKLAEAAFGSSSSTEDQSPPRTSSRIHELNRIVHPAVVRAQNEWLEEVAGQDPDAIAIVEAALLLEAGAGKHFDKLIVVTCSDEQRIARFATRQKLDFAAAKKETQRRMAAQLPEAEKIKAANFVIDNSGSLDNTRHQIQEVWKKLRGVPA